jgi:hypothetical protein
VIKLFKAVAKPVAVGICTDWLIIIQKDIKFILINRLRYLLKVSVEI